MNGRKLSAGLSALDGPLSECREAVHSEEVRSLFLSLRIPLLSGCAPSGNESWRAVSEHLHERTILHRFFFNPTYIYPNRDTRYPQFIAFVFFTWKYSLDNPKSFKKNFT